MSRRASRSRPPPNRLGVDPPQLNLHTVPMKCFIFYNNSHVISCCLRQYWHFRAPGSVASVLLSVTPESPGCRPYHNQITGGFVITWYAMLCLTTTSNSSSNTTTKSNNRSHSVPRTERRKTVQISPPRTLPNTRNTRGNHWFSDRFPVYVCLNGYKIITEFPSDYYL